MKTVTETCPKHSLYDAKTCPKINCIYVTETCLHTENSNRNLCQKCIVLCKLKTVTKLEKCLKTEIELSEKVTENAN